VTPAATPPGPRGRPLVGSFPDFRRDPPGFIQQLALRYGDVVRYRLPGMDAYLLVHPDDVRDVLVTRQHDFVKGEGLRWARSFLGEGLLTSEGEHHTRQRRLVQPSLHRQRIAGYAEAMTAHACAATARWRDGAEMDVAHEMMRVTLAIVGECLFGADVQGEAEAISRSLTDIVALFPRFAVPGARWIQKLPLPSNRRFARARAQLDATVYGLIAARRAGGEDRADLLSALLAAQDVEGDGGGMTDVQLRDEAMTLFLAGHETTANALTWTLYLLSQNPEAEARLHAEVETALGERAPTFEDLPRLGYVERVLAEGMRLFPPAWGLGRRALRAFSARDYVIPAGALVHLSPYATQRDPRWWPEPERFDPDRHLPEARAARPKFAYFPFGGGARACIGEPFAWMEGTLVLAVIAQRWRLRLRAGHVARRKALITLRPRDGMPMTPERRALP
jgi:cytochrome P450